jgi:hypothetical protein
VLDRWLLCLLLLYAVVGCGDFLQRMLENCGRL